MEGIEFQVKGDKLIITCDLTRPGRASSSGKTKLVATTAGAVGVDYPKREVMKLAVNLTVPA